MNVPPHLHFFVFRLFQHFLVFVLLIILYLHCSFTMPFHDHDLEYDPAEDAAWGALTPEVMPYRSMLEEFETVNVLAPLVRCSKREYLQSACCYVYAAGLSSASVAASMRCSLTPVPFRHLVSLYETHVTHTPMILAEEFSRSQQARIADFTTSADERGVFWMEPKRERGINYNVSRGEAKSKPVEEEKDDARERRVEQEEEELVGCTSSLSLNDYSSYADKIAYPSKTYHTPRPHTRLPPTLTPPSKTARLVRGALIAQMASPNGPSLADAAELIAPHVDGVDLNCGCPQRWAYNEGIGGALLRKPELVADMVRCTHDRLGWDWPVSIKIRVDTDQKATQTLVDNAIAMGVSHITIHGRTRHQASTEPVCLDSIQRAVGLVNGRVPTVANGDLWELEDARKMRQTGVDGVMAARGLLAK